MNWFFRRPRDPLAAAYRSATPRRVPARRAWAEIDFVVLDAETSGFKVGHDRLLSLAVLPVRRGELVLGQVREWTVFQPAAALNAATAVHGILPAETAAGTPEREVLAELLPLLPGTVVVGHHIAFDAAMLDEALRRHFGTGLRNPLLDTATLAMQTVDAFARTAYPGQRPPALEELSAHCGIVPLDRHTAAGDTFTTAELFLLLSARLRSRLGRPLRAGDLPLSRL